jgi:hypothetical protein
MEEESYEKYINKLIKKEQVIFGEDLNKNNPAKNINVREWTTQYGKVTNKTYGNTRIGKDIDRKIVRNFGCISDYNVDTLPNSYLSRNGIEKFEITQAGKYYNGVDIISRRFLSRVLSMWCYIVGIKYKDTKNKNNGINIWCEDINCQVTTGEYKIYKMLSGNECIEMLKDLLALIRNNSLDKLMERAINHNIISDKLYNVLWTIKHNNKLSDEQKQKRYYNIKNRLYYDYNTKDKVWCYPKYNPEYLIGLIKDLQSGDYFTDLYVPIINDLYKYPIECKDTHLKPMSDDEHKSNKDDYDLGKYIWEDY